MDNNPILFLLSNHRSSWLAKFNAISNKVEHTHTLACDQLATTFVLTLPRRPCPDTCVLLNFRIACVCTDRKLPPRTISIDSIYSDCRQPVRQQTRAFFRCQRNTVEPDTLLTVSLWFKKPQSYY